jgi:thioredoxin 1
METAVRESDVVVLVCTPQFATKANMRTGGVGYETQVVTGELFSAVGSRKFVPVLRSGNVDDALPSYLKGILGIDFRVDERYEAALTELIRHLWGEPPITRQDRRTPPSFGPGFRPMKAGPRSPRVSRDPHTFSDVPPSEVPDAQGLRPITTDAFDSTVIASESPVIAEFWAPWCGPCRVLRPILEELVAERPALNIVQVDIDEKPELGARFKILSIPTLIAFSEGEAKKTIVGAYPKKKILEELDGFLPEPEEEPPASVPLVALTLHEGRIKLVSVRPDGTYSFLDASHDRLGLLYVPAGIRDAPARAIDEFEALLNDSYTTKGDVKTFLDAHPTLILGGEYRSAHSRVFLRREGRAPLAPDFLLQPIAGELADVLEVEPASHEMSIDIDGVTQLSEVVVEACARLREYRDYFEEERRRIEIEDQHGIRAFRPRMFVVVGRANQTDAITRRRLETQMSDVTLRTWDEILHVAKTHLRP